MRGQEQVEETNQVQGPCDHSNLHVGLVTRCQILKVLFVGSLGREWLERLQSYGQGFCSILKAVSWCGSNPSEKRTYHVKTRIF